MVKLNKIYTRTGDKGTSGLVGGSRRPKYDLRFEAFGTVDEANSMIGIARCHTRDKKNYDDMLKRIQHDLFDLGADLATVFPPPQPSPAKAGEGAKKSPLPKGGRAREGALRIIDSQVTRLEKEIDTLNKKLSPLNSFVLPGGSDLAATLHFARTVTRRAERLICVLATQEKINPVAIAYINRLSDFLFVLARVANNNGKADILWEPGVNR